MDSQRSKKLNGSQFWALECLLTASGWLESIWAIMDPPRVITLFQSSCEIGLKEVVNTYNTRPHRMLGNKSPQWAEDNPTLSYLASIKKNTWTVFWNIKGNQNLKLETELGSKNRKTYLKKITMQISVWVSLPRLEKVCINISFLHFLGWILYNCRHY